MGSPAAMSTSSKGGTWSSINSATAGAKEEKALPVGTGKPIQLYSLATPNGQKVGVMFEELKRAGAAGFDFDAHTIMITAGAQFTSGFVGVNKNSKIPAMVDNEGPGGAGSSSPLEAGEGAGPLKVSKSLGRWRRPPPLSLSLSVCPQTGPPQSPLKVEKASSSSSSA